MTYEFLKTLYSDIILMLRNLVVKRQDYARENETADSIRAFDLYYACLTGSRYFYNFQKFDVDILEKYLDPISVSQCYYDPNLIPEEYRDAIVNDQAVRVVETYEEKNEYYRMLAGMPPLSATQWIYITDIEGIPTDIPIHEMSQEHIARLEIYGHLDKIKEKYPDAEYLNYLGINKIDILTSRLAKPFEILRLGVPTNSLTQKMFEKEYYKARRYVMGTIYNRSLFTNKDLYDPIIGVIMLSLAVRNTLVPDEAAYLNFEEILDAILESYGLLRYFENFPFTFKRRLVLALDKILTVKGTDGVLVDICRIFSMENFIAKRYYLMKHQPKDENGNTIITGDVEKDYELNFVKAAIAEHDISYSQEDITEYETVVNNDYLWQLTEEERHSMMNEDFNLMMSKYIDIEAAYDLSSLTFEVCYFLNLLLHSRENETKIRCTNKYSANGTSNIYTMIVFLLAGLAKRSNFDGNIVYDTENIAEILRFNSADITAEISKIVNSYEHQIDVNERLIPGYSSPPALQFPIGSITDHQMIDVYVYNRELYNAIVKEMQTTTDIRRYIALANAKECLYISYMEQEDFKKSDGTAAATYMEMLEDIDPVLAYKLSSLDLDKDANELDKMLIYILEELEELFSSDELKYLFLNTPSTYGALIEKYLRMAINVFKASSVQLESINVFFNVGDAEPIRIIDQKVTHKKVSIDDTIYVEDDLAMHKTIVVDDTVYVMDKPYFNI